MKAITLCFTAFSSAFVLRRGLLPRTFVSIQKPLFLNRVLISETEILPSSEGNSICCLPSNDTRSAHIRKILKLKPGDNIRVGVINKGLVDKATLLSDSQNAEQDTVIDIGSKLDLKEVNVPIIDLILASPRPPRLVYLLPVIACLGVANIYLIGASKVEKMYFSSHLFNSPDELNSYLLDGISQAGVDCHLPKLAVSKSFHQFMTYEIDKAVDLEGSYCVISHPPSASRDALQRTSSNDSLLSSVLTGLHHNNPKKRRIVIAIGPEGGWEEEEVQAFEQKGFHRASLGRRILRTDIAVPVALGITNEWIDKNMSEIGIE